MERHAQGHRSPTSSASCSPRRRHARRRVHGGHARAHRHDQEDVRRPVRADINRAPTRSCARRGSSSDDGDRRARPRDPDASLATVVASAPGRRGRRGQRASGYAQHRRARRQGDRQPGHGPPTLGVALDRRTRSSTRSTSSRDGRPRADDEIVIDKAQRRQGASSRSATRSTVLTQNGAEESTSSSASPSSATPTACRARPLIAVHAADGAAARSARPGKFDEIAVVAEPRRLAGRARQRTFARRARPRPDLEVITGAEATQGEPGHRSDQPRRSSDIFLLIFALVALLVGVVHHLQHVLDHRRAAHAGDGAAARDRRAVARQVLGQRARSRRSSSAFSRRRSASRLGIAARDRPQGAAQRPRLRPPGRRHRVNGRQRSSSAFVVGMRRHARLGVAVPGAAQAARVPPVAAMRDVAVERTRISVAARRSSAVVVAGVGVALLLERPLRRWRQRRRASSASARSSCSSVSSSSDRCSPGRASRSIGAPLAAIERHDRHARPRERDAQPEAHRVDRGRADDRRRRSSGSSRSSRRRRRRRSATRSTRSSRPTTSSTGVAASTGGLSPDARADSSARFREFRPRRGVRVRHRRRSTSRSQFIQGVDPTTVVDSSSTSDVVAGHARRPRRRRHRGLQERRPRRTTGRSARRCPMPLREDRRSGRSRCGRSTRSTRSPATTSSRPRAFETNFDGSARRSCFVKLEPGVTAGDGRERSTPVLDGVSERRSSRITRSSRPTRPSRSTSSLNLIYALLLLAIVIAVIGIANTLALSIYERTREIGLLRAVGMSRGAGALDRPLGVGDHRVARHDARSRHRRVLRLERRAGAARTRASTSSRSPPGAARRSS